MMHLRAHLLRLFATMPACFGSTMTCSIISSALPRPSS
jgi:hypothetical protein